MWWEAQTRPLPGPVLLQLPVLSPWGSQVSEAGPSPACTPTSLATCAKRPPLSLKLQEKTSHWSGLDYAPNRDPTPVAREMWPFHWPTWVTSLLLELRLIVGEQHSWKQSWGTAPEGKHITIWLQQLDLWGQCVHSYNRNYYTQYYISCYPTCPRSSLSWIILYFWLNGGPTYYSTS